VIWRFSGSAINKHVEDYLYFMASETRHLLRTRTRELRRLASDVAKTSGMRLGGHDVTYAADEYPDSRPTDEIFVRRSLELPEMYKRWVFIRAQGGGKLDRIIEMAAGVGASRF
jgi:hypothetical protein